MASLDGHAGKCTRCWGGGAVSCALCGGVEVRRSADPPCGRCAGSALERCRDCDGYGLHPPGQQ
jgi:hypothetical protein